MTAAGFFGKLPSRGDFVGRRLPPPVRDQFDRWLQAALVHSRRDLGDAWLPAWLSSPIWRFLVGAGVCGAQAWAGVMMPSHDRVGRCFPLLLAVGIDGTPSLRDCLTRQAGWFECLEDLALSALEEAFSLEDFDRRLLGLGAAAPRAAAGMRAAPAEGLAEVLADPLASPLSDEPAAGRSAWWSLGSPEVPPCLALHTGLPAAASYAALLDGQWQLHGWRRA